MARIKSIRLYFFSILKILVLNFKDIYFKSKIYNKNLSKELPSRIFYYPSAHIISSLISSNNKIYKIAENINPIDWEENYENEFIFENLHSFLWLIRLDRKKNKSFYKSIINSWIGKYSNFKKKSWKLNVMGKRIISWLSSTDLILQDASKEYKEKIFLSITKQTNHLSKNLKKVNQDSDKIICCAAVILYGLVFDNSEKKLILGLKELDRFISFHFYKSGFPKTRNPEDVYNILKYLIIIREWLKEAQKNIPDFLNNIILRCGNCYKFLSNLNEEMPLFNGATETKTKNFDVYLKNFNYKFEKKGLDCENFFGIKLKKFHLFLDAGNPPESNFSNNYQAGCLSFEMSSNGQKIICNSGYAKYLKKNKSILSCSTAAHSTLYLNDNSSCSFEKNTIIRKVYGNSIVYGHKILDKKIEDNEKYYELNVSHNGYEKRLGYIHKRKIKIYKKNNIILGTDQLSNTKNILNFVNYSIRFHIYPGVKIVKTHSGKSVLISLNNGEGWELKSLDNSLQIESGIFFGNKGKIIKNECIYIYGNTDKKIFESNWQFQRVS